MKKLLTIILTFGISLSVVGQKTPRQQDAYFLWTQGAIFGDTIYVEGMGNSAEWGESSRIVLSDTGVLGNQPNISILPDQLNLYTKINNVIRVQNLIQWGDTIYVLYIDINNDWKIAKKSAVGGNWRTFNLSKISGAPLGKLPNQDAHYSGGMSIDKDGFIHVVANTYRNQLRYIKSDFPLDITHWSSASMIGTQESELSYPTFINTLNDSTLLFLHRDGNSFDGDAYINAYNTTTKSWTRQAQLTDGSGFNFYWNIPQTTIDGRIHLSGLWRSSPGAETAEDICYFYSDDKGQTWKSFTGINYSLPITKGLSDPIFPTPQDTGLINQTGMGVDDLGRVSIVTTLKDQNGNLQYFHLYLENGVWQTRFLTDYTSGVRPDFLYQYGFGRPSVFTLSDRTYVTWINTFDTVQNYEGLLIEEITPGSELTMGSLFAGPLGASDINIDEWGLYHSKSLRFLLMNTPVSPECKVGGAAGVYSIDSARLKQAVNGKLNIDAFSSQFDFKSSFFCGGEDTLITWISEDALSKIGNTLIIGQGFNNLQTDNTFQILNTGGNQIKLRDIDGDNTTSRSFITFEPSTGLPMGYLGFKSGSNSNFSIENTVGNVTILAAGEASVNGDEIWDEGSITYIDTANWNSAYSSVSTKASITALNDTAFALRQAISQVGLQDVLEVDAEASFSNSTNVSIKTNGKLTFGDADDLDSDGDVTFIDIDEPNDVIQLKSESLILGTVVTGMNLSGDVQLNEDDTFIYFGSAAADGSFRMGVDSVTGDLVIQAKESGVWVTKQNYTTP
ncbi:BNR repeat-containing protein [Phaeocystidibacter marisrubri]|uniref:Uncharacterized protein n=1 Tax=Phaeocystidibacter marisrubri TaxID=1577780 RepID=A0A6L3ZBM6_9FLAO|nr:BNR repeat-containing protein [Phaeocystidibacter marisrubri]KAB2815035.1 hypothetical protein F8C82_14580 [Phaeocystidibacter marisrubri]GGH78085.1 hypothetical protein GCM10011318_28780 [Phaeocystidibacter marisrubri]